MKSEFSTSHYDNYHVLSQEEISNGRVRVDAYMVSRACKFGERDHGSGILFHMLKTLLRMGNKASNSLQREVDAIKAQADIVSKYVDDPSAIGESTCNS